jgi:hypothetical protein
MRSAERLSRLALGLLTVACAAIVLSPAPPWARAPFALLLVLWLPGRSLIGLALPATAWDAEARVIAVALSLSLTVVTGLALNVVGSLDASGWVLSLAGIAILGLAATPSAASRDGHGGRGGAAGRSWRIGDLAILAIGLAMGGGALVYAREGANAHDQYRYTEMWLLPVGRAPGSSATLGLRNAERIRTSYDIEVLDGGKLVDRWPRIALDAGETRTMPVNATRGPVHRRLEARLFKDGERDRVYRQVWIDVPPEANPTTVRD